MHSFTLDKHLLDKPQHCYFRKTASLSLWHRQTRQQLFGNDFAEYTFNHFSSLIGVVLSAPQWLLKTFNTSADNEDGKDCHISGRPLILAHGLLWRARRYKLSNRRCTSIYLTFHISARENENKLVHLQQSNPCGELLLVNRDNGTQSGCQGMR